MRLAKREVVSFTCMASTYRLHSVGVLGYVGLVLGTIFSVKDPKRCCIPVSAITLSTR